MKIKLFLFILYGISFIGYTQNINETETYIIWTKENKLKWEDFKGKEKIQKIGVAQTAASIEIRPFRNRNNKYEYKVLSKFYKRKSWTQTKNIEILKHEQLHFDIAELFARKMRKKIAFVKSKNNVVKEFDYRRIHKNFFKQYLDFQNKYDAETDYSKKKSIQKKYNDLVLIELKKLTKYSFKS